MTAEPCRTWIDRWERTLAAVRRVGGSDARLSIAPPATEAEVAATERRIHKPLPRSFRQVLLEFSGSVSMRWCTIPDARPLEGPADAISRKVGEWMGLVPVDPLREVPVGSLSFGVGMVEFAEKVRRGRYRYWLRQRGATELLVPWHRFLAWWATDDDVVAFAGDDIVALDRYAVEYPMVLAPDFMEFMERWTRIGCVQPFFYNLGRFVRDDGLDPDCDLAVAWRDALDLDL